MDLEIKHTKVFEDNFNAYENKDKRYIVNEGGSRCHAPGTLIRMYDGSLKKVEEIKIGDKVASYDGLSYNTVIDLHNGVDDMYLIKQGKGEDYIVNKNHLLSVIQTRSKSYKKKVDGVRKEFFDAPYDKDLIHHFSAEEWSKMSLRSRRIYSGFKNTFLELPESDLEIDPYYLGLWLGDGSSSRPTEITTNDKEIIDYLFGFKEDKTFLEKKGDYVYNIRSDVFNRQTELSKLFYNEGLVRNKHIPKKYIYSSYKQRLQLIAGLIDSDGHQTKRNTLSFTNINKKIIDGLYELLVISGFYTNGIREYISKMKREDGSIYQVKSYTIEFNSPDFTELNKYIKLERKKVIRKTENLNMFNTKIESIYIGKGDYYGFTLDKCPLYKLKDGTITHNSSKTYSLVQLFIYIAINEPGVSISVVRKTFSALRNTAMKDFIDVLKEYNLYNSGVHNKTNNIFTFYNGSEIEFFGTDDAQKLRGRKRDYCWCNEANELFYEDFKQLNLRTTKKIFFDYNPSENISWLYDLPLDRSVMIKSSYLDNVFLEKEIVRSIEELQHTDPDAWCVYGLGERVLSKKNVYRHFDFVSERPLMFKDDKFVYGLDFGYNHPSALIKIYYEENSVYLEEIIYESYLTADELVGKMIELGVDKRKEILADYARPEMIEVIRRAGFMVSNADKSVSQGINDVKTKRVYVDEKCYNIKKEYENYRYKTKGDMILDEPVKILDDAMDAIRYGIRYIIKSFGNGNEVRFNFRRF